MKPIRLSLIIAFLYSSGAHAQTDLTNNGTLFMSNSADILYVSGSLSNASTAALTNNGNLYVKQHLSNAQASMATGTGTLYLNGTANQNINGSQAFKTFNLVTNNSAGITVNNNLSVTGVHTFSNGIITTASTPNYLQYEAGSSYTGDGDAAHVNGWVRKLGTTTFLFPVGNGTVERRIGISALASNSVFNAKYMGPTTNPANLASPLVTVDPNEYWMVNQVSGGSAKVDMNWNHAKVAMPTYRLADIRVANYIASKWTAVGSNAVGSVTTTGTISSNTITSFGAFTFGSISMLVPMHLLAFNGQKSGNAVLLNWKTTDEVGVSHYELLKSHDGLNFKTLSRVAATNNTGIQNYAYTDGERMESISYYRLKSVDLDGKYSMSRVVSVSAAAGEPLISVVNPARRKIELTAENVSGKFQYRIVNSAGAVIQEGFIDINGTHSEILLASNIFRGVYTLTLQGAKLTVSRRLLVD